MAVLNPSDAQAPFTDTETGKVRFGDLSFNNILFNQINQILYLLSNMSMSLNSGDFERNTHLVRDALRSTELFLSSHLKKDKIYQKARKEIINREYPDFREKYGGALSVLNRYDTQDARKYNSIRVCHECENHIDQYKAIVELLMDWMDRKGIHFSEAGDSLIDSGEGKNG